MITIMVRKNAVLIAILATSTLWLGMGNAENVKTEMFFGEREIKPLYDTATLIVAGHINTLTIAKNYGGKARWILDIDITDVIKGAYTNRKMRALAIAYQNSTNMNQICQQGNCVLFLTPQLETVGPWLSIQPYDYTLVWALKELGKNNRSK